MTIRFDEPLWLALAALAVPLALIGLRWMNAMSRTRRWTAVVARATLLLLIAGALAGASSVRTTTRLAVIALLDVSDSARQLAFPDGAQEYASTLRAWLERSRDTRRPDDLFGVVAFDASRAAMLAPAARDAGDLDLSLSLREGTNIEEALRFANAMFPPGASRRLLLVSDGVETSGDALAAARDLASGPAATPVDVLPLAYAPQREALVEALDAPPSAARDSIVPVRVTLRATARTGGTLRLLLEGRPASEDRRVEFGPGRTVETFQVRLADRRVNRFEAVFEPDADADGAPINDRVAANNRAEAFTISPGRGTVLLVDGVSDASPSGAGRTLARAIAQAGIDVEVISPREIPADLLSLQNYDLVALQNVAADDVPSGVQQLLADAVTRTGSGLVMIGGPDSFGAGAWKGSPIEPILPVTLDLPEQLIVPPAAIVIVLDSSGSMAMPVLGSGRSQQDIANEGAARAVLSLDEQDLVGVLEFNNSTRFVLPLGPNRDPRAAAQRVRSIIPGGGTNLYPAIAQAGDALAQVEAQVKHVIVLTDGIAIGSPRVGFEAAERMRDQGITISTIAVGDGADTDTLQEIARRGGGAFYRVIDPNTLPRIFLRETRVVRKPLLREGEFTPALTPSGSPITAGMPERTPPLFGYVLTQRREGAQATYAIDSPSGEPILAHWNAGLGRVAAFTSDAHDNWARAWLGWPGYAQMWTQLVRTVARPPSSRAYELTSDVVGDALTLRLDARDDDGRPLDLLTVPGVVYRPDGTRDDIALTQTAPGVYEARTPAPESGAYVVALTPRLGDRALAPVLGGATRASGPELRTLQSNVGLLREVAQRTGGRVLSLDDPLATPLFDRAGLQPSRASLPIWRALLALAIGALLLDVATRRVAWDRWISREAIAELRESAAAARAAQAASVTGALRTAKSRPGDDTLPAPAKLERMELDPRAEAERRRAIRRAVQSRRSQDASERPAVAATPPASPRPGAAPGAAPGADTPGETVDGASGLLAAKRRARERMGGAEDQPRP